MDLVNILWKFYDELYKYFHIASSNKSTSVSIYRLDIDSELLTW